MSKPNDNKTAAPTAAPQTDAAAATAARGEVLRESVSILAAFDGAVVAELGASARRYARTKGKSGTPIMAGIRSLQTLCEFMLVLAGENDANILGSRVPKTGKPLSEYRDIVLGLRESDRETLRKLV